jgi:hypothetical protein
VLPFLLAHSHYELCVVLFFFIVCALCYQFL